MSHPFGPHTAVLFGAALQATPQARQFCVSSSLTQELPQALKPSLHAMPQPLLPQVALPLATPGQAVLQSLQCAGSLLVSTQEPSQFVVPLGHSVTHLPPAQAWSVAHGLSHPPQLAALTLVSTQAEPHRAKP
jgi:hypothetical protein